jgi:WD40 repeat protein/predicted Ser/Thr protein kinase
MSEIDNSMHLCLRCGASVTQEALGGLCVPCLLKEAFLDVKSEQCSQSLFLDDIPASDGRFGHVAGYDSLERIGRGGMGVVYRARQTSLNRTVALKLLLGGMHARENFKRRFRAEAIALAKLQHPNIVPIIEVGEFEGQPFFSMEYIAGADLAKVTRNQPLSPRLASEYIKAVAEALEYVHGQGLLHRDLKPSNIIIGVDGRPRITDFGLAGSVKDESDLTLTGQALGSPSYMPPEQAFGRREQIGPRSDVYGLGAVFYHLLTGRAPFTASTEAETLQQALTTDPVAPRTLNRAVPQDLDTICLKCLEKETSRRPDSAGAVAAQLGRWLDGQPIAWRPLSIGGRLVRWCKREPRLAAMTAGAIVVLLFGLCATLRGAKAEANAKVVARHNLAFARMRMAEDYFPEDTPLALAYLARVLRDEPTNTAAAERLLSALSYRHFAFPHSKPLLHQSVINVAHFSPDGRQLVTASDDGLAQIWDVETGTRAGPPLRHAGPVSWAEFSPDGRLVVSASHDGTAKIWNVASPQPTQLTSLQHSNPVRRARFSADGLSVVTITEDGATLVWSLPGGRISYGPFAVREVHTPVWDAKLSCDGLHLLTISGDWYARLWTLSSGHFVELTHSNRVAAIDFSPDGKYCATASWDHYGAIWDTSTGKLVSMLGQSTNGHSAALRSVAFSADGQKVVTAAMDGTARVWNGTNGNYIARTSKVGTPLTVARFNISGQFLVTGSIGGAVCVWDAATGSPESELLVHREPVSWVESDASGGRVLTVSQNEVRIWDLGKGHSISWCLTNNSPLIGTSPNLTDAVFDPSGELLATTSNNGPIRIWNARTGATLRVLETSARGFNHVRFSHNGRMLAGAAVNGSVCLWSVLGWQLLGHAPVRALDYPSAEFSPDDRLLLISDVEDASAAVWEIGTSNVVKTPGQLDSAMAAFSPDGTRFVIGSDAGVSVIYDSATGKPVAPLLQHRENICWVCFAPNGSAVATASWDGTAQIWSSYKGIPLTPAMHHDAAVLCVSFSPDGKLLVTTSRDSTARIWDAQSGMLSTDPLRHRDRVVCAEFSGDSRRVATASWDKTARVWDATSGLPVSEPFRHEDRMTKALFSPGDKALLTVSSDGITRLWPLLQVSDPAPQWLLDLAEALGGERLNQQGKLEEASVDAVVDIRSEHSNARGEDVFSHWARWYFAQPFTAGFPEAAGREK